MRKQPIWSMSVFSGLIRALLAIDWLFHGLGWASGMMALGALALFRAGRPGRWTHH